MVDSLRHEPNDGDGRVEGACVDALSRIIVGKELLVEVDHGVLAAVVAAEVGKELVDVRFGELLREIAEAEFVDVDHAVCVVAEAGIDGVEERVLELHDGE